MSTLLPYINDITLFPEAKFIVLSISTPLESIANIIDLIGIFARPHPYFLTIHKKTLAVERLCIKIENVFLSRDFLCTRQENIILRTSEGNWARKTVISKIYISFPRP